MSDPNTVQESVELTRKQLKEIQKAKKRAEKEERRRVLRERRSGKYKTIQSTQMAIPIVDIYKQVVITRDNRFLKIMEFKAQNLMMFSHEKRNQVDGAFESAMRVFPVKVQFKVFSRKADVGSMIEPMRVCREHEKVEKCQKLLDEYIDYLYDTSVSDGVTRRFLVVIEYDTSMSNTPNAPFDVIRRSLENAAQRITGYMSQCGNDLIPSCNTDAGIVQLLYEILNRHNFTPNSFEKRVKSIAEKYHKALDNGEIQTLAIPANEFFAPAWIDYRHPRYIVVDGKFYAFGYLTGEGYVSHVPFGWLSGFVNACEGIDIDVYLEKVPKQKIRDTIARRVTMNDAKLMDTNALSAGASQSRGAIESGMYLLQGLDGDQDFYYASVMFTVCTDSLKLLNTRFNELCQMATSMNLKIQRTNFQMEEAFLSSLPICKLDNSLYKKSRRNVLTSGAASFYPFVSFELQDPGGIMVGVNSSSNSMVAINTFDTKSHTNANVSIVGQSGFGKTFTAQLFALRMRLQQRQVFIITPAKGRDDYLLACNAVEGQFVAMGPGSQYHINIMDVRIPDSSGLDELGAVTKDRSALAQKVQSLHTFFSIVVRDLAQEEEQLLDGYIYQVYADYGITDDNDSVYIPGTKQYKQMPVLGDLYEKIKDVPDLRRIANIMLPMISGSMSSYNNRTNVNLDNLYIVFDMDGLSGNGLVLNMFIVLDFVWQKIKENRLKQKAVFLDEAWKLIGEDGNIMTAEYVQEIFKTIRAYGGAAFIMTQQISDFYTLKDGVYGNAIFGNCDTKVFLHSDKRQIAYLKDIMTITPDESDSIQKLTKGKGLVIAGNSHIFVDFRASQAEFDVISTDPNVIRAKLERERAKKAAKNNQNETIIQ